MVPPGFRVLALPVAQLSLPAVLKCGQSFRWQQLTVNESSDEARQEWRLALPDRVVCLRQSTDSVLYRSVFPDGVSIDEEEGATSTLSWLYDYFQLNVDLVKLYAEWSGKDHIFKGIAPRFPGIRMLRQDPWENVISFICSQNNHISRITSMVQNLCTHFSPALLNLSDPTDPSTSRTYHAFPPPKALADPSVEAKLRNLGFGYRAKYIQKTAALLCESSLDPEDWLQSLRKLEVEAAREELLKLHGVGPKVADCILLMSLDKTSVVPVDTHVYQIAVRHYGFRGSSTKSTAMTPKIYAEVTKKLTDIWGSYAGWAHSILFTADLKSFSQYGLLTPGSLSPALASDVVSDAHPLPPSSPSPIKKKRKQAQPTESDIGPILPPKRTRTTRRRP